jgi:hypothetical protein
MRSTVAFLAVLLLSLTASAQTFVFHLRGDQEVPPVTSTASGGCMGTLNQPAAQFTITCVQNVPDATVMHIHRGPAGTNGPAVFDLGAPTSPVSATWSAMTPADIADLLAGNLYVNVHSAGRPAGEVRGQILTRTVDLVNFTANGAQAVPPNGGSATATCSADLSNDATSLAVQCTHDVPSPEAAEIHEGPAGTNGPTLFVFPTQASPLNANVPMTPQRVAEFAATFLYLEIREPAGTEEDPSELIRGQIGTPPAGATTGTIRIHKSTSPAGGSGFSFTSSTPPNAFVLNDGQTQTFANVTPGTYLFSEDDPSAGNFTLADITCTDTDGSTNPFARTATVNLQAGETVDCTFRNMQTAPTDQLLVFHLSGDQEVPPITTPHRGGCMGRFNAGSSQLTLVCTHDVPDATVMHIHRGAPGVNGAVAFDLGNPVSPVLATWTMLPADVAELLAGNLYVNVHTPGRPGGEIRGQLLTRTVDTVNFPLNGAQVVPPAGTSATGTCTADLDTNATSLAVNCTHNLPSPEEAHVHQGDFGMNGPVVFEFANPASPLSESVPMTPRLVADFAGRFLYLDIHGPAGSEETAGEQIRGQIGAAPAVATTGTIRIVKESTPSGATGFGFTDNVPGSPGTFTLADGGTQEFTSVPSGTYTVTESLTSGYTLTDVVCTDNDSTGNAFSRTATINLQGGELVTCTFRNLRTYVAPSLFVFHLSPDQEVPPQPGTDRGGCMGQFNAATSELSLVCTHNVVDATVMHIHRGAAGINGSVAFDLGNPSSPVNATWSNMSPADVADLMAGNFYVNVHTAGRPGGAIRGQIVPRSVDAVAFTANAAQEVPPTDSSATGQCTADLSNDATSVFVSCDHTVTSLTGIHLHAAPPGINGPIIFDFPLADPFSGTAPLTPRLVADFAAGFLYVNIHSAAYTEGEIRGQLLGPAPAAHLGDVPTLGGWMTMLMAAALLAFAFWRMK